MHGLIHQIWATWEIEQRLIRKVDPGLLPKIDHHFGQVYFAELHAGIREILTHKVHLMEGGRIPDSFYEYMKHSIMEKIQIELWEQRQISTAEVKGFRWNGQFPLDVEAGLKAALRRRQDVLAELRPASLSRSE